MHGVPEDFDYSVFVGAGLERVCFGPYIVHLAFSSPEVPGPLHISIEGSYIHAGDGWRDVVRLPIASSRLMQLTNHLVTKAARIDASRMRLDFDHGHSLTLVDDSDQYESFQIEARGRLWIV